MRNEDLFYAIGDVNEKMIEDAGIAMNEIDNAITISNKQNQRQRIIAFLSKPIAAVLVLIMVSGVGLSVYALEMNRRYNAAVDYLRSLGVEAEDLSDYSHSEIREAAECFRATEPAPADVAEKYMKLYEKVYGDHSAPPVRPSTPTAITSDDVRKLTPTMTYKEVTATLGDTVDIGSGFLILLYEVDGEYTLSIPFAGLDAQLGVTGETLLKALQPK